MYLEKWYADRVRHGRVQIRYLANLHWGPVCIGYTRHLQSGVPPATHVRFGAVATPAIVDGALHWPADTTLRGAVWTEAEEQSLELARVGDLAVRWSPIVANGCTVENDARLARGYVERLVLTLPPWRLGLGRLKWGRFCGKRHSLIWIEWEGRITKRVALLDRGFDALLGTTRKIVRTAHAHLRIGPNRIIVSERLGAGPLNALGIVQGLAVQEFLAGVETKWFAPATLELNGAAADSGYVIHEEVVWA